MTKVKNFFWQSGFIALYPFSISDLDSLAKVSLIRLPPLEPSLELPLNEPLVDALSLTVGPSGANPPPPLAGETCVCHHATWLQDEDSDEEIEGSKTWRANAYRKKVEIAINITLCFTYTFCIL